MENSTDSSSAIQQLAEIAQEKGLGNFAKSCGVSYQAVQKWIATGRVPAGRCLAVEKATDSRVMRYALRPDVFGIAPNEMREVG